MNTFTDAMVYVSGQMFRHFAETGKPLPPIWEMNRTQDEDGITTLEIVLTDGFKVTTQYVETNDPDSVSVN